MNEKLIHEIIPVGMLQCNCSILGDPVTLRSHRGRSWGRPGARVANSNVANKLKVRAIVSTHTHIDHVGGFGRGCAEPLGAPVLIHERRTCGTVPGTWMCRLKFLGPTRTPGKGRKIEDFVKRKVTRCAGAIIRARVIHTPGHTPGSISLYIERGGETGGESGGGKGAGAARSFLERQCGTGDSLGAG